MPVQIQFDDSKQRSHSVSYYSIGNDPDKNNRQSSEKQLLVNCTGIVDLPFPFTTHVAQGRRDFYLLYMNGGKLSARIGKISAELTAGDVALILPGTEYRYTKSSMDEVRYLWVHFTGFGAKDLLTRFGFADGGIYRVGFDEGIAALFMAIMEDFIRRDDYFEESAAVRLSEIIIAMRRRLDYLAATRADSVGRIFGSIKYIHNNFKKPISNEALAAIEHLSVSQYIELFRKCTGTTPRNYLIELRLRSACDLLRSSDLTIAQIAEAVGYGDAHYFSRIFKVHRGVSPDRYRMDGERL